ncbi:MAG: AMP-binding protein [Thermodesulfobacteriota bacterium]
MQALNLTLPQLLDQAAAQHPDHEALVDLPSGRRLTYAGLRDQARALALGLLSLGLAPGRHLALWAPNQPEWLVAWFAAEYAGLVLTSVDTNCDREQLAYVLGQSQAQGLILAPGLAGGEFLATLSGLCPGLELGQPGGGRLGCPALPDLERVVVLPGPAAEIPAGAIAWEAVLAQGRGQDPARLAAIARAQAPDQPATLLYTSGTTGAPKGVLSPHHGLINTSAFSARNQGLGPDDRLALSVPLCHMFGCVCVALAGIIAGATLVIPSRAPDPAASLSAVAAERLTAIYGPPTSFIAMLNLPEYPSLDLKSLRTGIMAGAQCPIELMRRVSGEMGVSRVLNGYGQTEASSWIAQTRPDDPPELRVASVGRAIDGVEVKVIDPVTGQALAPGQVGEICARGFNMVGYYQMPAATKTALDPEGWLHTGDLGSLDADGYIRIAGRLKEVIRKAGLAIYPAELEEVLYTHPAVHTAQVVGAEHERLGEEVAACIKLRPGQAWSEAGVLEFLRGKVPASHLPGLVRFVDAFPMTPLGKIQKFKLRAMLGVLKD